VATVRVSSVIRHAFEDHLAGPGHRRLLSVCWCCADAKPAAAGARSNRRASRQNQAPAGRPGNMNCNSILSASAAAKISFHARYPGARLLFDLLLGNAVGVPDLTRRCSRLVHSPAAQVGIGIALDLACCRRRQRRAARPARTRYSVLAFPSLCGASRSSGSRRAAALHCCCCCCRRALDRCDTDVAAPTFRLVLFRGSFVCAALCLF